MKHKSERAHYSHSIAHSSVFEAESGLINSVSVTNVRLCPG